MGSFGAVLPVSAAPGPEPEQQKTLLEEIIVTAPKLNVPAREVSGSVTVVSGTQLDAAGAQDFADYLTNTPGVVFNASIPGNSPVTIRGIATTTGLDQG